MKEDLRVVYKYPLEKTDVNYIELPMTAKLLHVASQYGDWMLWALVNPREKTFVKRGIRIVGTGHRVRGICSDDYINTFTEEGGALVWHAFQTQVKEEE